MIDTAYTETDTRSVLLDAAERLFAEKGFGATSVREITRAAGANVAAVHYHFGSKEDLLRGVTDRVMEPLNRRRIELLDAAVVEAAPDGPALEAVIEAFVRPDIELLQSLEDRGPTVAHFLGNTYGDPSPWIQAMAREQLAESARRFLPEFAVAAPRVPADEVGRRMEHVVAVLIRLFATWPAVGVDDDEADATVARLVAFLAGGLGAPVPATHQETRHDPDEP